MHAHTHAYSHARARARAHARTPLRTDAFVCAHTHAHHRTRPHTHMHAHTAYMHACQHHKDVKDGKHLSLLALDALDTDFSAQVEPCLGNYYQQARADGAPSSTSRPGVDDILNIDAVQVCLAVRASARTRARARVRARAGKCRCTCARARVPRCG